MKTDVLPAPALERADRIAAIWIGRLGDLIIATPFLRSLRRRFPRAEIVLAVGSKGRDAAGLIPDADRLAVWSPACAAGLIETLSFKRSDILIDLNTAPSKTSALLAFLARARVKLAFDKGRSNSVYTHVLPAPSDREHMLDRYARLARAVGADYDPVPSLRPRPEDVGSAEEILRGLGLAAGKFTIAVHPGNFKKFDNRWPEPRFIELTNRLLDIPAVQIVYMAGPGEEGPVAGIVSKLRRAVPVILPLPAGAAAAVLSRMDLFLGNATGTAHLAVAVGTPTFTILSGYTKAIWMPRRGPHFDAVSGSWESCRDVPVEAVWRALGDALQKLGVPGAPPQ